MKRTRQHFFFGQSAFYAFFHLLPHLGKVIPQVCVFISLHIFPIVQSFAYAIFHNILHVGVGIYVGIGILKEFWFFFFERTAANTVNRPTVYEIFLSIVGFEFHCVWMKRKKRFRLPNNRYFHARMVKNVSESFVCEVSFACGCQTSV